jgi:hypothetical protein
MATCQKRDTPRRCFFEHRQGAQSTPDLIRQAMAETRPTTSKPTIPLNGEAVLKAALADGSETINGGVAE